jgi:four helix bundle protein
VKTKLMRHFRELEIYQNSIAVAMHIFKISKTFPAEERYWLTGQVRRSLRSACANIAKDWRKRRYKAAFISKLSDTETEATKTQVWCQVAYFRHYIKEKTSISTMLVITLQRSPRTPTRPHADR